MSARQRRNFNLWVTAFLGFEAVMMPVVCVGLGLWGTQQKGWPAWSPIALGVLGLVASLPLWRVLMRCVKTEEEKDDGADS